MCSYLHSVEGLSCCVLLKLRQWECMEKYRVARLVSWNVWGAFSRSALSFTTHILRIIHATRGNVPDTAPCVLPRLSRNVFADNLEIKSVFFNDNDLHFKVSFTTVLEHLCDFTGKQNCTMYYTAAYEFNNAFFQSMEAIFSNAKLVCFANNKS